MLDTFLKSSKAREDFKWGWSVYKKNPEMYILV